MKKGRNLPPLPPAEDAKAVAEFAGSFDGYVHFGSFEACAGEAMLKRRKTLIDIRNELFFEARASYHACDSDYLAVYRELLPLFEKLLREGEGV